MAKDTCRYRKSDGHLCKNKKKEGDYCAKHAEMVESATANTNNLPRVLDLTDDERDEPLTPPLPKDTTEEITKMMAELAVLKQDVSKIITSIDSFAKVTIEVIKHAVKEVLSDTNTPNNLRKRKKRSTTRKVNIDAKSRSFFFHENKTSEAVLSIIRTNLKAVNMYIDDKHIPWQLIKCYTNKIYDQLSQKERAAYELKANASNV